MKKIIPLFLLLSMVLSAMTPVSARDIYVSKSGNNNNPGTLTQPYLTIAKASAVAAAGDVIYIREGTYEETIRPTNSGTNGNPIVYSGYQSEKVIVTAMEALSGFELDAGSIYKKQVNWDLGQRNFVMSGTTALDLARWPNNTDGDRMTINSIRNDGGSQDEVSTNAFLTDADIPNWDWSKGGSVMFYGDRSGSGWTTWRAWIKSQSAGRINFDAIKNQKWIITAHPPGDLGDYFLEGIKEALDYENEWYFDPATKTLYVQLPNGTKPVDGQVKMAKREKTVDLTGRNYIELRNMAVFGGNVVITGTGCKLYGVSSFYGSMTRGITPNFNSGINAIDISWGAKKTTIEKCEVGFGDGSGVWDSGSETTVKNCYIHDFDFLGSYDAPLMVRGQNGAKVLNNKVTRGGRDALQIISKGSEVAYNDFSYSNLIADDCALLYTIGANLNMDIHHNWFHDAASRGDLKKAAGIYLDNDAGNVRVYRNVVWNVEWTAVQINWNGTDIDIFNNSFAKAQGGTMGAWHKAGTQFSNVKVWNNITDVWATDNAGNQEQESTWEPQSDKQNNLVDKNSFEDWANNEYKLKSDAQGIDYGREIAGYTDGYVGSKPDVGAYELGDDWVPGVDWDITAGPNGVCYGLPGEPCAKDGGTPIEESIAFVAPPLTLEPNTSYSFDVAYSANQARDIIVEIKTSTGTWVGRARKNIAAGAETTEVMLNLNEELPAGEDYTIQAWLVPVGLDWQDIIKLDNIQVDVIAPVEETIALKNPPVHIASKNAYTFSIDYTAAQARDIIIEVKSSADVWLGNVRVNVPAGTATTTGSINFENALPVADDYKLATFMVPTGLNWESTIVGDNSTFNVVNYDCNNDPNGTATVDACGVCSGGSTGVTPSSPKTWYADTDGDGLGDPTASINDCEQPTGYVAVAGDACPTDGNKAEPGECGCGQVEGTCNQVEEVVSFVSPISTMETGTNITFEVNYTAEEQRDVVLIINSPAGTWLGNKAKTVEAGSNTITLTITLANAPAVANDYQIIVAIRPVGGVWDSNIDSKTHLLDLTPIILNDCAGVKGGTATVDACGVCAGGTTGIPPSSPKIWYADTDGDGLGDPNTSIEDCNQPAGYVAVAGDDCPNDATNSCHDTDDCNTAMFDASSVYDVPQTIVKFEGKLYANQWYVKGIEPTEGSGPWKLVGYCEAPALECGSIAAWDASTEYATVGTLVVYNDEQYKNKYWSKNQVPGVDDAWEYLGPCKGVQAKLLAVTGIEETTSVEVIVYPNPTIREFTQISISGVEHSLNWELIDSKGNIINQGVFTSFENEHNINFKGHVGVFQLKLYNNEMYKIVKVSKL